MTQVYNKKKSFDNFSFFMWFDMLNLKIPIKMVHHVPFLQTLVFYHSLTIIQSALWTNFKLKTKVYCYYTHQKKFKHFTCFVCNIGSLTGFILMFSDGASVFIYVFITLNLPKLINTAWKVYILQCSAETLGPD